MIDGQTRKPPSRRARITLDELVLHGAVLLLILVVFFPGVFLKGEMALPGELLHNLAPWRGYIEAPEASGMNYASIEAVSLFHKFYSVSRMALDAGEWPLWNHLEQAGLPLLANYQSAVLYPPRLLHAFLPLPLATTLYVLLKLWLCGFNAYLLGRGIGLHVPAARFLSIAWMASGFCMVWAYWTPTDVAAWFPVAFLGTEWLLAGRYRRGSAALLVGGLLLMLAGQPQVAFVFALGLGMYVLLRCLIDEKARKAFYVKLLCFGALWACILLASAAQILPFLEYLSNAANVSTRMGLDIEEFSYRPSSLVALWVSRFFGTDVDGNYWYAVLNPTYVGMLYGGIVVWLCLPYAFLKGNGEDVSRKRPIALASIGVAFGLLAWRHPALEFLYDLPTINSVRPAYFITFALFALPVLAALGVNNWLGIRPRNKAWIPSLAILAVIGFGVGAFYAFQRSTLVLEGLDRFVLERILLTTALVAATLSILSIPFRERARRFAAGQLALLVLADLVVASIFFHHTSPPDEVLPDTALTDYLNSQEEPKRVSVVTAGITLGLFPCYGIETWMGYDALYPKRIVELREGLGDQFMATFEPACAVSHYLYVAGAPPYPPQDDPRCLNKVATVDGVDVYENTCAMPRAYLAARVLDVPDEAARFSVLASGGLNPRYTAIIEEPLPGQEPSADLTDLGQVEVLVRTPAHVQLQADSQADCVLVLADAYYPGWKATIDGQPADVFPVNHAFRGVPMPSGSHIIEFRYDPRSFAAGLTISTVMLVLGALGAIALIWKARQPVEGAPR